MKVAGLGQCSLDYIALLERFPVEDTKEEVLEFSIQGGGPVATALVSLARLGVNTGFQGLVCDDDAGRTIMKGLKKEGVDIASVKVRKGGRSQTAFILVNKKSGSRTILWAKPAGELRASEVDSAMIKSAGLLLVDGLMRKASLKAVRIAKKAGVPVMLDAGRVREGMLELAGLSDFVVASAEFARGLGLSPKAALKKLSSLGVKSATITLGRKGSVTWSENRIFSQDAFKVKALDTTGAGDVFHGGYAYGLLRGWDIEKTVKFASAFAALKCLKLGGRSGIPTLKQTLAFIRNRTERP